MHLKSLPIYLLFNVLSALIPILAMPFLTSYLTPVDYGLITTFTIATMFAGNIFRLELNTALKRNYVDRDDNFSDYISTAFVFSTTMVVFYCVVVVLLIPHIDTIGGIPSFWLIPIVLLAYFRFQTVNLHHLWQISNRALPYGIWGLTANLAIYAITITLILFKDADWQSRAWGEWLTGLFFLPIAIYFLRKNYSLRWHIDFVILRKMLRFSLPLLPSTLMGYFFLVSDRLFISQFSGLYELGLYSVAVQLASTVDLVFRAALPTWESWIFTRLGRIDQESVRQVLGWLLAILFCSGIAMLILPQILSVLMPLLTDEDFASAESLLLPCLLSVTCAGFYRLTSVPLVYMKRTASVSLISGSMIAVNLLLMYFFVSKWGASGAAYALAATFSYGSALQIYFMFRHKEPIETQPA